MRVAAPRLGEALPARRGRIGLAENRRRRVDQLRRRGPRRWPAVARQFLFRVVDDGDEAFVAADGQRESRRRLPDERLQLPIAGTPTRGRPPRQPRGTRRSTAAPPRFPGGSPFRPGRPRRANLRTDAHLLEQLLREHVVQIGDPALIVLGDALIVDVRVADEDVVGEIGDDAHDMPRRRGLAQRQM